MGSSRIKRALLGIALSATMIGVPQTGHAATTVVYPASLSGWVFDNSQGTSGAATFEEGPATPPAGFGSLRQTANTGDKQVTQTAAFNGVAVSGLTVSYSTYSTSTGPTVLTAALNMSVDYTSDGFSDETLVYEPYEQASFGTGAAAVANTWQTWNASAGKWWSTATGPGGPRFTLTQYLAQPGKSGAKLATFTQYAFRIAIGSTGGSWPNFTGYIDNVKVNATTYDFEAARYTTTVVVRPNAMDRFVGWTSTCGGSSTGSKSFVTGPATPPAGTGSFQMATGSNGNSVEALRNTGYGNKRLDTLTALRYGTYVTSSTGSQAAYLVLDVDYTGDAVADDRLFFEPAYQNTFNASSPTLATGQWQIWNALTGGWWSNNDPDLTPGAGVKSIAYYLTKHPLARILNVGGLGGLRVQAGCGVTSWANFSGTADRLSVGFDWATSVYDFETNIGGGGGDFVAPDVPIINTPLAGALTKSPATVTGLAEANSIVRIYESGVLKGSTAATPAGTFSVNVTLPTGMHTVTATATDGSNNISAESFPRTFEVDATAPTITLDAPSPIAITAIPESGTATDNKGVVRVEVAYFLAGTPVTGGGNATCATCGPTATSVTWDHTGNTSPGYIEARYTAVDVVGNKTTIIVNYLVI